MKRFAIIGVGGFIAPKHLKAIKETGNELVAALDPKDSVGILDSYSFNVNFFTEFERFDRYAEKIRREGKGFDFVTICSPNYLHDAHINFALRIGADVICEKPLVLNPWNLDAIEEMEKETGKNVYTVLQLRFHPEIKKLEERIRTETNNKIHEVELSYITPRGKWYDASWKGDITKSGGVVTNIGIHFFDMLTWIFGKVKSYEVYNSNDKKISGYLSLEKANVKWFLSLDYEDLPDKKKKSFRNLTIDGKELEFSEGFTELHTEVYKKTLVGEGFRIKDARQSIELVYNIRNAKVKNE